MNQGEIVVLFTANKRQFDKSMKEAEKQSKDTARSMDSSLSGATSRVGNAFASLGRKTAAVAWGAIKAGSVAATSALVGLGAKGLISANNLQSLQISMNGLTGSIEQGNKAMAGAYKYAQKAPFQLPEVAGTTKTLIAYGLSASEAVKSLEMLGNVSITSGVPIEHIGSIFGQVSSQGKLMLQDIRQLTQNGIGILPALQKQFGKTAQEVQDMATDGEISFEQFRKAMGSMVDPKILEQLENTMPRQIDRIGGSIRILSNAFVGVSVDAQKGFSIASDGLQQAAIDLVRNVADTMRSPEMLEAFSSLGKDIVPLIQQISSLITPLAGTIIAIAQPIVTVITGLVGGLASLLSAALPGIELFLGALNSGLQILLPVVAEVGTALGGALSDALTALAPAIQPLAQAIAILLPVVAEIIGLVAVFAAELLASLMPILPPIAEALVAVARPIIDGLKPILPVIISFVETLAGIFVSLLTALLPVIPILNQLSVEILQAVLVPILPIIGELLLVLADAFIQIVQALLPILPPLATLISSLIQGIAPILPLVAGLFLDLVKALLPILPPIAKLIGILLPPLISFLTIAIDVFMILSNILATVVFAAIKVIISIVGGLIKIWSKVNQKIEEVLKKFSNIMTRILNTVRDKISGVINFFRDLPGKVVRAIGNLGDTLVQKGKDLIQGLLKGAGSLLSKIGSFFLEKLPSAIRGPFKKALGISSPSKEFAEYGVNLIDGLINGMFGQEGALSKAMGHVANTMTSSFNPDLTAQPAYAGASIRSPYMTASDIWGSQSSGQAAGSAAVVQNNIVNTNVDMEIVSSSLTREMRRMP